MDEAACEFVETLTRCFADLEDPRVQASCDHLLIDILAMTILGVSCGADEWTDLVVVHDELDLEPGTVRLKSGGGLAGHNGLRSIDAHLGTRDFARVRIGVGKPPGGADRGADWVLSKVSGSAREVLEGSVERAADAIEAIVDVGLDAAMVEFNARR